MDESTSRERRARTIAREIATYQRAIEVHEQAVAKFTEVGHAERAEADRTRLKNTRKLLQQALDQARDLLQEGYAAMAHGPGPDEVAHAIGDGRPTTLCGLDAANMIGVAEHFRSVLPERRCSTCATAIDNDR